MIAGRPLDKDNLSVFIDRVYKTGNYQFVITRTRAEEARLEVLLYPVDFVKTTLALGGGFQGTLSAGTARALTIRGDVQFRGLTGPGSALVVGSSWTDDLSLALFYVQPLGRRAFVSARGEITINYGALFAGFPPGEPVITGALGQVSVGMYMNENNTLTAAGGVVFADPAREYPAGEPTTALYANAVYEWSRLDYGLFATRGFYAALENTAYFPLPPEAAPVYDVVSLAVSGAIPLNRSLSVIINGFAGSDVTGRLIDTPSRLPLGGFTGRDRMYFPHITAGDRYGAHKGAASLILQYQPWQNLTFLGGQLLFSVSAAVGEVAADWGDFSPDGLLWNASLNAGLRLLKSFGAQVRIGAGKSPDGRIGPFVSLDIGAFRY
ncbi:hypothetical protein FACS189493_4180 [Spirochaetia bacterium]|nr:hypothetical protein FACS189493_4180 [Spirochaetia bacterium]